MIEFIVECFLSIVFVAWGITEIKTGRVLLRRKITRESDPFFYWVEVMVSFFLAGIILFQAVKGF